MAACQDPREDRDGLFDEEAAGFYRAALATLAGCGRPHLVGGAYAMQIHTGLRRHTKDLDVFVHRRDLDAILAAFTAAGYRVERPFPHWLAKVGRGELLVDLIHGSGNGLCPVDDAWFTRATAGVLLDRPVQVCAVEEVIWSKAFIMERERFDGADILHLLRCRADRLDWPHLLARFGEHWRVLLAHLVLFGFVYPHERRLVPPAVLEELLGRCAREDHGGPPADARLCRGPFISRAQYLVDLERWGYADPRLAPDGPLSADDVALWTAPIAAHERPH